MKSTIDYYRMDRRQISFLKFILEAYDNMAVLTTVDAREAIVKVTIAPGCETVVRDILTAFNRAFEIAPLDRPTPQATLKTGTWTEQKDPNR